MWASGERAGETAHSTSTCTNIASCPNRTSPSTSSRAGSERSSTASAWPQGREMTRRPARGSMCWHHWWHRQRSNGPSSRCTRTETVNGALLRSTQRGKQKSCRDDCTCTTRGVHAEPWTIRQQRAPPTMERLEACARGVMRLTPSVDLRILRTVAVFIETPHAREHSRRNMVSTARSQGDWAAPMGDRAVRFVHEWRT